MQWHSLCLVPVDYSPSGRSHVSSVRLEEGLFRPVDCAHRDIQECSADFHHCLAWNSRESRFFLWQLAPLRRIAVFTCKSCIDGSRALSLNRPHLSKGIVKRPMSPSSILSRKAVKWWHDSSG